MILWLILFIVLNLLCDYSTRAIVTGLGHPGVLYCGHYRDFFVYANRLISAHGTKPSEGGKTSFCSPVGFHIHQKGWGGVGVGGGVCDSWRRILRPSATVADLNLSWLLYWLSTFLLYNYFFFFFLPCSREQNGGRLLICVKAVKHWLRSPRQQFRPSHVTNGNNNSFPF